MPDATAQAQGPPFLRGTDIVVPSAERLAALYAFTRAQREANAAGYERNVAWWGAALGALLSAGWAGADNDTLALKVDDGLLERLGSGSGARPRGIAGVIDTLTTTTGPFVPMRRFVDSPTPIEEGPSIASRLVRAGWGVVSRLSPFGGEATEEGLWRQVKGNEFAYLPNVKTAASAFEKRTTDNPPVNYTEALFTRASFFKEFANITKTPLTKRDVDVLVRWLARDVGSIVVDGDVIKLLTGGQVPAEHPVTEADRGALSVLHTLASVEAQIASIEAQAVECQVKAKHQLAAGHRTSAASYLRSKKQLDDLLGKRIAAGEQLRSVVRALDQAKGDAEVMSAYEASTAALASALSDPRLSPDRIASTTDALADALADQKEIDDAVQLGTKLNAPDIDEDELEQELAGLVLEEKAEQEKREKVEREEWSRREKEREEERAREAVERKRRELEAETEKRQVAAAAAAAQLAQEQKDEARIAAFAATGAVGPAAPSHKPAPSWEETHAAAQERSREEKARAEAERLKKEEQLLAAE